MSRDAVGASQGYLPFNRPYLTGREFEYMQRAVEHGHLSGDGRFTAQCQAWLKDRLGCRHALLTHSCTGALEMAALLAELEPGDEILMPSFTFVSTANAFVLRGARPVFIDIRSDTLNIDETVLEEAITPRTRAVVAVHYAGVPCEMETIAALGLRRQLIIIEDAAQALGSSYRGRSAGSLGHIAAVSFHETKNVIAGEGGALLLNDDRFIARAEIVRDKGTDRSRFLRGQIDKYTWVDLGSSYVPSELTAAFLLAQMEQADPITSARRQVWDWYYDRFAELERQGCARRPIVPGGCDHNAHMFYLLVRDLETRTRLISHLNENGVNAVFHYVPLHSSDAGRRFGRAHGALPRTNVASDGLIRLPLWIGMTSDDVDRVARLVEDELETAGGLYPLE
jgi:dTDP-4-amino-4,6-dideoxygalactose transaminase